MVDRTVFLGSTTQVLVRLPQGSVVQSMLANAAPEERFSSGEAVTVFLPPQSLRVLASSKPAAAQASHAEV
jgi:hypothetical protein